MVPDTNNSFCGPMFLVGMPRSGTKLLREMLNQHPRIRFSEIETDFLPYWIQHWPRLMPIESRAQFGKFYDSCLREPFFLQNADRGIEIDGDRWFEACTSLTPSAVFEGLLRCCLSLSRDDHSIIWGDKSPSYIRHIPLLIREYPDARFVHIVRDVRDYSLSIRHAWGKSILRAAQRWQDDVSKAMVDGKTYDTNCIVIRYEDLLDSSEQTLKSICAFIGVEFDARMLTPGRIVENLGTAKHNRAVMRGNTGKYLTQMSPDLVAKLERIASPTLRALNYPCAYRGAPIRLPVWRLRMLQCFDGLSVMRAGAARFGLFRSITFNLRYFRMSGNRKGRG